jgi:hypothetical protein
MKNFVTVLFISFCLIFIGCAPKVKLAQNPKIANYWLSPVMDEEEAERLARFHLVIADMENMVNNYASLVKLKKLNPKVKLLAYSNPMEFFVPMVAKRPLQTEMYKTVKEKYEAWWLKQPSGQPVKFFRGMSMLNLSIWCPVIDGKRWNQYHAEFLVKRVLSDKIWDGYFMDNSGGNVSWIMNGQIDADNDGVKDDPVKLDQAWFDGIEEFLTIIRQAKGEKFIMIGNKMTLEYVGLLNGKMSEEFPNNYLGDKKADGWYQSIENYLQAGSCSIIHALQIANTPEHRLFVITSALMGDGYYTYGMNLTRRFPEYEEIGKPLGPAIPQPNFWMRKYEKAIVKVWPEEKKGTIEHR